MLNLKNLKNVWFEASKFMGPLFSMSHIIEVNKRQIRRLIAEETFLYTAVHRKNKALTTLT